MAVNPAYLTAVKAASAKYGVPAELLAAQIQAESGWNPNAKSGAGAVGISQFMKGTAEGMGLTNRLDPLASIDAQGRMMGRLLKSYGGNVDKALAAYNAGAGAVAKYNGVPPYAETHTYIDRIHGYEKNYPGLAAARAIADGKNGTTAPTIAGTVPSNPSQTAPTGSLPLTNTSGQTPANNTLQNLLSYAMQGSAPSHSGADTNGNILNVLLGQGNDTTAPTIGQTPSVGNTPSSADNGTPPLSGTGTAAPITPGETPMDIINKIALPLAAANGVTKTVAGNTTDNHNHTHLGSASDHSGNGKDKWAADFGIGPDIRGGKNTDGAKRGDAVAKALAKQFGIPWTGKGISSVIRDGYRYQLLWRYDSAQAGNHYTHVHLGIKKV